MRKINDVKELFQDIVGVERKIDDFSNMDLSHLDLSKFNPEFWKDAIFYNTNLSNTGIRFNPEKLGKPTIEKCNFENVDLSYIDESVWGWICITDANLRNTGIKLSLHHRFKKSSIGAILLDESFNGKPAQYWDMCNIDFSTLRANRFIRISSYKLFELIYESIYKKCTFLTPNQIEKLVEHCEKILKEFDNGTITRLYELVCKNFDSLDKLKFFQGSVEGKVYQNFILNDFSAKLLCKITFSNCSFEKIEINNKLENLLRFSIPLFDLSANNSIQRIELSDLNLDSWKSFDIYNSSSGTITFKRFIYLELGFKCNCNCKFCRNKSFDGKCETNLNKILANLDLMKNHVDTIFIGGGEPSLYIDDIIKIYEKFNNLIIVTNGTMEKEIFDKITENGIGIYISRHAISDEENQSILNPDKSSNILSMNDIKEFAKKMEDTEGLFSSVTKLAFTPVCIKGGLDSSQKIVEYIAMSFECGIKEILISTLHRDASMGKKGIDYENLYVDPNILNDVFSTLLAQGFERKRTICSTGGYILKRFVKDFYYIVSFKIYISKEQFPKYWKNCVKRTFDFTMTPNGDVYQDWCKDELVNLEALKVLK